MNAIATDSWYTANRQYLAGAVASVHWALEKYIARKRNQSIESPLDDPKSLERFAAAMSRPPILEQLCTTFNLSAFERNILLLGVGMAIFPDFPALCVNAHDHPEMPYPTLGLALGLFPETHWSALTPQSPLRRWQLIEVSKNNVVTLSPFELDETILHYLLGEPYQDEQLDRLMQPLSRNPHRSLPLQPSYQQIADQIAAIWLNYRREKGQLEGDVSVPIIQLCGSQIAAKSEIAVAAGSQVGHQLKVMPAHRLPRDTEELDHLIRRWQREVVLTGNILVLDCEQTHSHEPILNSTILPLIEDINTPLIITTPERLHSLRRPLINIDIPKLTHQEQLAVWQFYLGTMMPELNGYVENLVAQFNLNSSAIQAACLSIKSMEMHKEEGGLNPGTNGERLSLTSGGEIEGKQKPKNNRSTKKSPSNSAVSASATTPIQQQLWDICRSLARPQLDDLAQRIQPTATWEELVLPEPQKKVLGEIATHLRQRVKVYQDWGFASKSSRGLGISAMFSGASGTGKTMASEVLAQEFHLDLYRIDLSAVVSKYIGETEKNLRRIFDAAEAGGAILLFDEADALFGKRTQVKDSHDRHANVEVSYLLQRMEAYQGLAILTTNLKDSLDQAFLRRIRFIVPFPFPDAPSRTEIWRHIFPKDTPTKQLDFNKLGKLNMAGGNIRNIAMSAAFMAAEAREPVMMKHILQATKSECVKIGRALTDVEIRGWVS